MSEYGLHVCQPVYLFFILTMALLFYQKTHPFPKDQYFGVAIQVRSPGQYHPGLIYRHKIGEEALLCHFSTHFNSRVQPLPDYYFWGYTPFSLTEQREIATFTASIHRQKILVPYGFAYNPPYFTEQGDLLPKPLGEGLTCATFLLAILEAKGYSILDRKTWTIQPDDQTWRQQTLDALKDRGTEPEHLQAMTKIMDNALRYRPEEVVAGIMASKRPLSCNQARKMGKKIVLEMVDHLRQRRK
ncbi:hypothetical protein ACQZV8_11500 [Magnetococcales bacterium HHB-1]